ncbi:MAG TPA: hypothetical protein ENJ89_09585 [Caldithrix abyssi]|uniref:Uncharacterized protein n=1 Tax=Caldithrix abyssi TaxID=187145 RepID=A0A7V5PQM0_CALAY|nr:hypothetical protein [Caldithrix abyssi]
MTSLDKIKRVKSKYQRAWLSIPGVVAVGIGTLRDGSAGIIVSVERPDETVRQQIPERVEDVPVEIQVTGKIKAL